MREKYLITDPADPLFTPKTLESFLSQKRTSQTRFCIAARLDEEGIILWFASKWHTRVLEELEGIYTEEAATVKENSWRTKVFLGSSFFGPEEVWGQLITRWKSFGYDLTPVRSFRRFTR